MNGIYATRQNWMTKLGLLKKPFDYISIHPVDDLTEKMIVEAMSAQGMKADLAGRSWEPRLSPYAISKHGNRIAIQFMEVDEMVACAMKNCHGFPARTGHFGCWRGAKCPHKDFKPKEAK